MNSGCADRLAATGDFGSRNGLGAGPALTRWAGQGRRWAQGLLSVLGLAVLLLVSALPATSAERVVLAEEFTNLN